ncbi:MAG: NUDIX hydrolase [Deltaproteobacteria bacterium]|nr:NUDIX hydrolase [Deltaproteobacteria bacterium]MBW1952018.1 NUDIX hydrolase [Deltaproteobacteria bacterium]MBW1986082.1 NUDIX hydrolase [Deltaproteobacteria bacterium]MBW2134232.1 NUDIX hydrolase [Deltaproteobacteria bacterium]
MTYREELYKFCPQCGGRLVKKLLKTLEPPRLVCSDCGFVFYLDPKLAAIAIIPLDDGVVLLRRAIEPGYGLWVVPGGFVDLGERVEDTAVREVQEEVLLKVRITRLLNVYSYIGRTTVVVAYITEVLGGTLGPGDETLDVGIFRPQEIPWDLLAFPSSRDALADYLNMKGLTR